MRKVERRHAAGAVLLATITFPCFAQTPAGQVVRWEIEPQSMTLDGRDSLRGILVSGHLDDRQFLDLTHTAEYRTLTPSVCQVDPQGRVHAVDDGEGAVEVRYGNETQTIRVTVRNTGSPPSYNFQTDVMPVLSRFGCNSSGCHGKAEGQNGLKLSVFGFDPRADYEALVLHGRGRRVSVTAPRSSLLLSKASGGVPHGGGVRITPDSREYKMVRQWIAAGAKFGDRYPEILDIHVSPPDRVLPYDATQQLRVIANFSDGSQRDVTELAKYQTNNESLATVSESGQVEIGNSPGHVAIMASFLDRMDTFQMLVPHPRKSQRAARRSADHFVDRLVDRRLDQLNIMPSGQADDATYLRRVYLDIIGTLPTAAEARQFLSDGRPDKRQRLVDRLLERPEYAEYWALKWSDALRVDRQVLGHKAAYAYHRWIRESLSENMPLDEFARRIVAARGLVRDNPAANFYKVVSKPGERASVLSQVFLGVRIECAQCHHHPFDRWSVADYHGMLAFFQPVSLKSTSRGELLFRSGKPVTKHPRTGEEIAARPLRAETWEPSARPREELAAWLTSGENPWFARNIANRFWAHFLGRGLIEPVDDVRGTNPPTNADLLDALAESFVDGQYDVKALIRTIVSSQTYQRATTPNETNARDEQNYSRALFKRMDAEVLLDAVCQVLGIPEKFPSVPAGGRAIELWDSASNHYFLNLFGRPLRKSACQCERNVEPSVGQVLHVMNSPEIHRKLTHEDGNVAKLVRYIEDNRSLVDELYVSFFSRFPTEDEREQALRHLGRPNLDTPSRSRRDAAEDLAWSMLNSYEFLFNH